MRADRMVASYRVSTARQEASGLDAQRQAVAAFLGGSAVVAEFTETESGKRTDRPELARAISACRLYGARLVIAKLDRLSRDAHFLLDLEKAGVDFVAADMPHANRFTVGIMAPHDLRPHEGGSSSRQGPRNGSRWYRPYDHGSRQRGR